MQHLLETFRPLDMDLYDVKESLTALEPHVKRLEITQLLTPVIYTVSFMIFDLSRVKSHLQGQALIFHFTANIF